MNTQHAIRRRTFMQGGAALPVLASSREAAAAEARAGDIPARVLGKTGLTLPILGYGGAALPAKWSNPLSYEARVALVRYAYDQGLRYFDTAGNYLESQAILGVALKDRRRDVCLVTKVETTQPEEVRQAVEKSLKDLQTDHVDALLIHGTPGLQQMSVAQAMKIHAELLKLRDEKVARRIGFSAHGYFGKALALIKTGGFDLCMLSYGYIPRGHDQFWSETTTRLRDDCLACAHERGMGIVAMKVIGAGMLGAWSGHLVRDFDPQRLKQLAAAAIRHVLHDPRVHVLTIGMRLPREIDANIGVLAGDTRYTAADRALLAEFSARLYATDAIKKMRIE